MIAWMRPCWRHRLLSAVLLSVILFASPARALEVAVVLSQPSGPHRQFRDLLGGLTVPHRLTEAGDSVSGLDQQVLQRADLIIAVGAQVTQEVLARFRRPTMAVLVSRAQIDALGAAHAGASLSAIVLDQPAIRHLRLASAVAPGITQVGMLTGTGASGVERGFAAAATETGLKLVTRRVGSPGELLPQLEHLLEASDALLMIPDPIVASQSSARTILLTSYRYRRPILAYSHAYVEAGALAAVFSSPEDVAGDVADWLRTLSGNTIELPPIQSPRRFSLEVNRQVARALGLDVPDDEVLVERVGRKVTP